MQVICDSIADKRFAVAQLSDEGQYLVSGVSHDDDTVAGLVEDMKDMSATFDRIKFSVRRKLVDLKQTFETNVVEVSSPDPPTLRPAATIFPAHFSDDFSRRNFFSTNTPIGRKYALSRESGEFTADF